MQRKTVQVVLCVFIAIGSAVVAWRSHCEIDRARIAGSAAEQERSRLAAELRRLEGQIGEVTRQQSQAKILLKQADHLREAGGPGGPGLVQHIPFDNAEMQARNLRTVRSGFGLKYGAFYRALGLDADRIAKFEALLAEYEGRKSDILTAQRAMPIDHATAVPFDAVTADGQRVQIAMDPSIANLRRDTDRQLKEGQTTLLGADGYARLQEFETTTESRSFVGDLVGNLSLTAYPLTAEQGKGLVQALQAGNFSVKIEPEKTDWSTILMQARPLLTPAQFDELQALASVHKLKVARNEISQVLRGARK